VVFVERHNVLGTRRDRYSVQGGTVFGLRIGLHCPPVSDQPSRRSLP
jgi:hypothetical protein